MKSLLQITILATMLIFTACAHGKQSQYFSEDGLFLQGYDPVSYSQPSGPKLGSKKWTSQLGDSKVQFVSKKNKELFDKNPEAHTPAYNGYCAYAMADGKLFEVNPKNFKRLNGKTHLFYENLLVDTQKKWNQDEASLKSKADQHWAQRAGQ